MTTTPLATVAEQLDAIAALRALGEAFPHLPAVDFRLSRVTPGMVDIHVHDGLGVFEAWRTALGIAPEAVELSCGRNSLRAVTSFCGAEIELVGYGVTTAAEAPTGGAL